MSDAKRSDQTLSIQLKSLQIAQIITATILTGFTLWALRRILEPFVLAVFLLFMIDGLAGVLRNHVPGFPRVAALPAGIAAILAIFGLTIWLTLDSASGFTVDSAAYTARINALLSLGAQHFGLTVTPTAASLIRQLNPARFAGELAAALSHFTEGMVFTLVYLGFLLASRPGFAAKAQAFFQTQDERLEAAKIFDRIRTGVERYVWVQTVVGLIITALSAAMMWSTGLTHVPFWCAIIFLANYIPAIGAAIGVLFPAAFGLLEFDGVWRALVLLGGLEAIHFAVSHVVQPRMQGKSLNVDPIVVLLALAFWGVLWGVIGAFLSTPLTVMAMAILAEFKGTRPLAVLLSSDGKPYADLKPGGKPASGRALR
jgi:AI-2 transport protein TqsA